MIWRNGRMLAVALFVAASSATRAEAQPARGTTADSVGRAVQAFYNWYLPRTATGTGAPWMRAIRERRALFAPAIIAGLRQDSVASARSPDEIVGLDGDPFLNSQDPCDRYEVRRVRRAGERFLADVFGAGSCGRHAQPDVVVEVVRRAGGWRFENFRYSDPPGDLLALLRELHPR
jgi:hypothetical protein